MFLKINTDKVPSFFNELKQYFLDIISTVGPDLRGDSLGPKGENSRKLCLCYTSCLEKMKEQNLRSIAFPCISSGIYEYPKEAACQVALEAVIDFMLTHEDDIDLVVFCVLDKEDLQIYQKYMSSYFTQE